MLKKVMEIPSIVASFCNKAVLKTRFCSFDPFRLFPLLHAPCKYMSKLCQKPNALLWNKPPDWLNDFATPWATQIVAVMSAKHKGREIKTDNLSWNNGFKNGMQKKLIKGLFLLSRYRWLACNTEHSLWADTEHEGRGVVVFGKDRAPGWLMPGIMAGSSHWQVKLTRVVLDCG